MARLTGQETTTPEPERQALARRYAEEWGHVIVLKGAFTVIAAPDGRTVLLPFANPALASAGTGDILAGAITALRAQGVGAFEAAAAGAYLHGLAGELVREQLGDAGVAASDVARALPEALRRLKQGV
ncbi:MAG: Bifunctional NAD(P)H-hydrate repair enzyme Nnr [Chloroflexi bacterium ADurb.Bin360]|nr:MAG: Bifunctional NAD(P)H-hydrate repair enzyme Nnr [Chloroflexi bacterium ADurb.Bin360]